MVNNGSIYASEQGDFVRIIPTHDLILSNEPKKAKCNLKTTSLEQGDSKSKVFELDGFDLPTLFDEAEDLTHITYDSNDFKCSDLFDENG